MNHILGCLGVKICFSFCMCFITEWYQRLFADSDTSKNILCWNTKTCQDSWGFVPETETKAGLGPKLRHPGRAPGTDSSCHPSSICILIAEKLESFNLQKKIQPLREGARIVNDCASQLQQYLQRPLAFPLWRTLVKQRFATLNLCNSPHTSPGPTEHAVEQCVSTASRKDTNISRATKAAGSFLGTFWEISLNSDHCFTSCCKFWGFLIIFYF